MRPIGALIALATLVPVMAGSPAQAAARGNAGDLVVALCAGDTITIRLGEGNGAPDRDGMPDCAKACHACDKRRRLDRTQ